LLALLVGVFKPWGFLCRLAPGERWQLWLSIAGGALAITVLKRLNHTSCPWDLAEFGGVARHVSHWLWGVRDGGAGHCFPAGHASTAFAYLAGWFVLRRSAPRAAGRWLLGALLAGMLLGLAQQMRGAHYMSHTLWTAWICWAWGLALETALQVHRHGRAVVANLNQA
jgi:membrane-associated PAP2 superfamily phosphatase